MKEANLPPKFPPHVFQLCARFRVTLRPRACSKWPGHPLNSCCSVQIFSDLTPRLFSPVRDLHCSHRSAGSSVLLQSASSPIEVALGPTFGPLDQIRWCCLPGRDFFKKQRMRMMSIHINSSTSIGDFNDEGAVKYGNYVHTSYDFTMRQLIPLYDALHEVVPQPVTAILWLIYT